MTQLKASRLRPHSSVLAVLVMMVCSLQGIQANAQGNELFNAAESGDLARVKALLAANADVNARTGNGVTALMVASQLGHFEIVRTLLDAHADVNVQANDGGATALMVAAQKDRLEILRTLLAAKADVNEKTNEGGTALHYAAQYGHQGEVASVLIEAGADVNAKDSHGETPLILASRFCNQEAVRVFIAAKADVNVKTVTDGDSTALIIASQCDNVELVRMLLAAKADVNAKDSKGFTALAMASWIKNSEMIALLKSATASGTGPASKIQRQGVQPSVRGATSSAAATTNQKPLPTLFDGTWVETDGEGKELGRLVIDANSIKWDSKDWSESFSVRSATVTVQDDGSLSFTPKMSYFSGMFGRTYIVGPNVNIGKNMESGLLVKITAFKVDMGGAFEAVKSQEHTLSKK